MIHEIPIRTRLLIAGDAALAVPTIFRYDPADPFAIQATFLAAGDEVEWVFARELLCGGLTNDMGVGDVRAWPSTEFPVMFLSLSSPEGEALIELPRAEVKAFLDFTFIMVPSGSEVMDMDTVCAKLLGEF